MNDDTKKFMDKEARKEWFRYVEAVQAALDSCETDGKLHVKVMVDCFSYFLIRAVHEEGMGYQQFSHMMRLAYVVGKGGMEEVSHGE